MASLDDVFAGSAFPGPAVQARTESSSKPRKPRPARSSYRGPSRLPQVAGALVVVIALGGVVFGVQRLTSDPSGSEVGVDPSSVAAAGGEDANGPEGEAATKPGALPSPSSSSDATSPSAGTAAGPRTGAASKVKLGVFANTSRSNVSAFGNWLGRDPDYVIDFSSRSTWDDIANPTYMLSHWRGAGYRMVYSVAPLPYNGGATVKAGSQGAYDSYFKTLARNLVAYGQEDAIIRLGWEFNLSGWRWSTKNPKDFIGYWRHIVTAMRSVPGQKLKFDWNPNVGETVYEASLYYPGGKYVDYIGVDVYDVSWDKDTYPYSPDCNAACRLYRQEAVWDRLYGGPRGLAYWADFARSKDKPMSIPEWSAWLRPDGHGGGDNPYFVKQMYAFMDDPQNHVAYQGYLEADVNDGKHKLTTLKNAGRAYKNLFK